MGFKFRLSEPLIIWEPDLDSNKIYINVLELLVIIISVVLAVCCMHTLTRPPGGWIIHARANNTSALSCTHTLVVQHELTSIFSHTFCLHSSHLHRQKSPSLTRYPTLRE